MVGRAGAPQPPLSVSHRAAISCLEQEQKVAQDDLGFLRWAHPPPPRRTRAPAAAGGSGGAAEPRSPHAAESSRTATDSRMLHLEFICSQMDFLFQV